MDIADWAGMATTCFFAAVLQATSGFGFAVLAVPFFLLFAPPGLAVKTCIILSLAISSLAAPGLRHAIEPSLLLRLTIGSIAGLPVGLLAFSMSDPVVVRAAAGLLIAFFAAVLVFNRYHKREAAFSLRPGRDLAAGAVAGAATALVGMSGPPVLIYLMLGGAPMATVRATLLAFFALIYAVTVAAEAAFVGLPGQAWLIAGSLLPLTWGGALIGLRLGNRLDQQWVSVLAVVVLGISGIYTLINAATGALAR